MPAFGDWPFSRSDKMEMSSVNTKFDFRILYSDGVNIEAPRGWYWRLQLNPTECGPAHGPFETEEKAQNHAIDFLATEMGRLARRDGNRIQ